MSYDTEDDKAKIAGAMGAGATTTGISVATAGASAAEITAALAATGGVVGGGMAAGIGIVAAAPVLVGGAIYGLYKWLS